MSKGTSIILILVALAAIAFMVMNFDADVEGGALPTATVDIQQTEEGNMPEYDVIQTEEGNMPEYDMDVETTPGEMPDVDVETTPDTAAEPAPPQEAPAGMEEQAR